MAVPRGWKAASWLEQLLPMQEVSGTAGLGHWQGELSVFLGEWMVLHFWVVHCCLCAAGWL